MSDVWPTPEMVRVREQKGLVALPAIEAFIRARGGYSMDEDQEGSHGNTNYVALGHRGSQAVVFKYFFDPERRERELYGLRHWEATGLVPKIVDDDGSHLLVQSRLRYDSHQQGRPVDTEAIGGALGEAVARLFAVPLSATEKESFESRFYGGKSLEAYVSGIVDASRRIQESVAEYASETFDRSLSFLESQVPYLLTPPFRLYHQDAGNLMYEGSQLVGFFDLEMCRVGTLPIQIGCVMGTIQELNCWESFSRGFERIPGQTVGDQELVGARAWSHFMTWRYVSNYGDWRGEKRAEIDDAALSAEAERYRSSIERIGT